MVNFKKNAVIIVSILLTIATIVLFSLTPKFFEQQETQEVIIESTPTKLTITQSEAPNFSEIKDVKEKKSAFFNFIYPMIVNNNIEIIKQRDLVENSNSLTTKIYELCTYYRIECTDIDYKTQFLNKVNIIPASLTLAQAANESAWGTSRFARNANNYFGQWCFTKGCGLVPKSRNAGAIHEVQRFENVEEAVTSYIRNLNSHPAYEDLRNIRTDRDTFKGKDLAEGLSKYSERSQHYIDEIKQMINFNKLQNYDQKMAQYLGINI